LGAKGGELNRKNVLRYQLHQHINREAKIGRGGNGGHVLRGKRGGSEDFFDLGWGKEETGVKGGFLSQNGNLRLNRVPNVHTLSSGSPIQGGSVEKKIHLRSFGTQKETRAASNVSLETRVWRIIGAPHNSRTGTFVRVEELRLEGNHLRRTLRS